MSFFLPLVYATKSIRISEGQRLFFYIFPLKYKKIIVSLQSKLHYARLAN